ncbi:MAG: hypothetical protein HY695_31545, partial [Deltaproteobacteria bacterium]|nr:hypothetical protein [Deltaproteobacteria bacterium]
ANGITFALNTEVPVVFKYLLDQVTTPSGTSVRYSYYKQSSVYRGISYDQAVYPDTITYAYHSGSAVGSVREVRFNRASRDDWTDVSASQHTSYHERSKLDSIEIKVGTRLARKYVFGYDYSIDRDPTYTWGGGATGDLTLKSVTTFGTDGGSLPPLALTYADSLLASASNGLGGSVSFTIEKVTPLYIVRDDSDDFGCSQTWHLDYQNDGYICEWREFGLLGDEHLGNIPIYLVRDDSDYGCSQIWRLSDTAEGNFCETKIHGYVSANPFAGGVQLVPLYLIRKEEESCSPTWELSHTTDGSCASKIHGYVYPGTLDHPRHRVIARTLSDGLNWDATTTFNYWGSALAGDEFWGHGQVRTIDPLGNYTDTFFHQDDWAKKGRPYRIETKSSSGALWAKVENTWTTTNPYTGTYFASLTRVDNYQYDGQQTAYQTAQTFAYDSYGNPTQTYSYGKVGLSGDERDERTDWTVNATTWIHRPTRTALYDNLGATVREKWLSYDTLGRLIREESRLAGPQGNPGNPAITYGYNDYGNRTTVTDPRSCTITTGYDASQTYPATVTNCLQQSTTLVYDDRFGAIASQTDPNSQTTTSLYDQFGRISQVTGPLDTSSTYGTVHYDYLDWGNPSLQRVLTKRTEQHGAANFIWTEEYFDGLGRVDRTISEGPGGQTITVDTEYDARGQVEMQSAPRFSGIPVWTTFDYDVLGRQTLVTNPDGSTVGTNQVQDVITITDERGNIKRRYLDAYGRLRQVDEINGAETYVTTYQYDAAGSLRFVTDHLTHVTEMRYDPVGRKTYMQDPNTGTSTYSYDLGGNLLGQTDAKNQTLCFSYDNLSRPLTRKRGTDTSCTGTTTTFVTWTYDTSFLPGTNYSVGRVTQVEDLSVITKFRYDEIGQVTEAQRTLNGQTYTMLQGYDALGRITSETFPDQDTVTYTYNEAGWLNRIIGYIDHASCAPNCISYNARGQKTSLTYANGLTTNWIYDDQTFRVANRSTGNHQDLTYGYDPAGNLTSIVDNIQGETASRTFTNDPLNRLASASGGFPGSPCNNYGYNAIGNITDKCGIAFQYADPVHPSAVTSQNGKSYTYYPDGNMWTAGPTGSQRTFTWNFENRLESISIPGGSTTTFEYDYTGARVEKSGPLGTVLYPFKGYEISAGTISKYIKIGIETYALKKGSEKFFYHNDHLGGVNVITDIGGNRVQLVEYDPWGNVSRSEGNIDPNHRFTGQELDLETGLYYYGGRYYDPELGRFISPDPFVGQPGDPQNLNRYSYVVNNPQNYIDPDGYFHRHKKPGVWKKILGGLMIFAGFVFPPALGLGEAGAVISFAAVAQGVGTFIEPGAGVGPTFAPTIEDSLLGRLGTGSFFSLALAMAECEGCPDSRLDLLRVLLGFLRTSEAPVGAKDKINGRGGMLGFGLAAAGRHEGFIKNLSEMANRGVRRTIGSLEKRIAETLSKLADPKQALSIDHHLHEIRVFREQLELARGEALKRGLKLGVGGLLSGAVLGELLFPDIANAGEVELLRNACPQCVPAQ